MYAAEGEASDAYDEIPDLIPIYRAAGGIDTWQVEAAVKLALDLVVDVPDILGEQLRTELDLIDVRTALRWIHRPDDNRQLGAAKKRLKLDEALVTQVVLARRRAVNASRIAKPRPGRSDGLLRAFDLRHALRADLRTAGGGGDPAGRDRRGAPDAPAAAG